MSKDYDVLEVFGYVKVLLSLIINCCVRHLNLEPSKLMASVYCKCKGPPAPLIISLLPTNHHGRVEEAVYHLTQNLSTMITKTLEMTVKLDIILDWLSVLTPTPSSPKSPPTCGDHNDGATEHRHRPPES